MALRDDFEHVRRMPLHTLDIALAEILSKKTWKNT